MAILQTFSISGSIILVKTIQVVSRQGFALNSINHGLKFSSNMKSRPKSFILFPIYFECVGSLIRIYFMKHCTDRICGYFFHLRKEIIHKVYFLILCIKIGLEIFQIYLVSEFEFPILLAFLLYGVIR